MKLDAQSQYRILELVGGALLCPYLVSKYGGDVILFLLGLYLFLSGFVGYFTEELKKK